MDVYEWMLRVERRLLAMEQRVSSDEADYHKYLAAGKTKKVLDAIEKFKEPIKEPVKETKPLFLGRTMWRR